MIHFVNYFIVDLPCAKIEQKKKMEQPPLEQNQTTDLTKSQMVKCPKPFSIESIISSRSNSEKNIETDSGNGEQNVINPISSSFYFPPNTVSMATAAASIYNPWIHNYFLQQQKLPENVFEMMQFNSSNHAMIKEKFNELFVKSPASLGIEQRSLFSHSDSERNPAPQIQSRFIEQYFNGSNSYDMISSVNNDYYKHLNNFGTTDLCRNPLTNIVDGQENPSNHLSEKEKFIEINSEYENSLKNDDSGPDENIDDDLDSDCNSEISLNMSPDGDNNTQGRQFYLLF